MRETRHLWIGNLAENVREEKIAEHFKRYGKIDKVRFLPKRGSDGGLSACVAFMDIRSAQKAKAAINVIGDRELITDYYDPSSRGTTSNADEGTRHSQPHRTVSGRRYEPHRESVASEERHGRDRQSYDRNYQQPDVAGGVGESYDSDRSKGRIDGDIVKARSRNSIANKALQEPSSKRQKNDAVVKTIKKKPKKKEDDGKLKNSGKHKSDKERGRSPTLKQKKSLHASNSPNSADSGEKRSNKQSGSSSEGRSSSSGSISGSTSGSGRTSSTSSQSSSTSSHSRGRIEENTGSSESSYEIEEGPNHRKLVAMCIKKLPVRPTVTSLRDGIFHEFKKYGKVKSVVVRGDGADRYALVLFRSAADANKAVSHAKSKLLFGAAIEASIYEGEVSGQELEECGGIIDEFHPRASRTLFVGNLDKTVGYSDIQNIFVRFGEIVAIEIKKQHNIPQYAFLQYTDILSVVRAITKMDGEKLGRNTLKLGFGKTVMSSCLWVDGVTDSFTENYLASCFQRYGPVKHVIIDRNRGKALVFYAQYEFAQTAMTKMRARKLNGSRLKLDFASNELIDIFLKHMQSSGQSIQGLENIRQLLQPTASPPATTPIASSGTSSFSRSQDTRSSYYEDRSQPNFQDDQYATSDTNFRRNWRGRSRERFPYPVEQSTHGRHGKRNYDEHYERSDYHRDRSPPAWEHDTYNDRRSSLPTHYDQDYRQKDYDVRREHRGYNRKPTSTRGNVPYEEVYHYRGSRDRGRDGDRDVDRVRDRERVGEQYYSQRSAHLSPSNPRFPSRRSRSLSPRPGTNQRDLDRTSIEKNTSETYRRRGPSRSRSPDLHPGTIRRRNSMESKSSSHSGSRYTARTGDVDMRESMSLLDGDEKLSVSSPLEGDPRVVEYSEKQKKLRVKKRVTADSPMRDFSDSSPKVHRQLGYKTSASSSKNDQSSHRTREYEDNDRPSGSPVYSETRSRSGTPTRDENADLIGEVIIKQPKASGPKSRSGEKLRKEESGHDLDKKEKGKPRDKDYRKVFTNEEETRKLDSGIKSKTVRSSSSSLIQRVHSPIDLEKKAYAKDLDYRKHSMVRSTKSGGSVPGRHTPKNDGENSGQPKEYNDMPSDSPRSITVVGEKPQRRVSGASKLLKREYSPRPGDEEECRPTKVHKTGEKSKVESEKLKHSKDLGKERDEVVDIDDRRTHSQKRRHSAEDDEDAQEVDVKRERKSSSSDSRHKPLHQLSQKHEAPMSIARQMFLQEEDESGAESPGQLKKKKEMQNVDGEKSKIDSDVEAGSKGVTLTERSTMDDYSIAAAVSLLPKKVAKSAVPQPEIESMQAQIDKQTEKVKKEARDGNLTDLEKEKQRLQTLLSKLDSERHLDVKEAAEVADVVLQELTQKVKSKIIASKPVKETPPKQVPESISKPAIHSNKPTPDDDKVDNVKVDEDETFVGDDVTFEEEIVVDTIEVTEDEVLESEVEEVIVTSEINDGDMMPEVETTSSEASKIPEVVVPTINQSSDQKPENIDHTQGYRKQMEAQKKELDKMEKKKEHDRKKLFRKQEKEKKKQMKKVSAMRGPSQCVVSSIDDADDDTTLMKTVDEVLDEDEKGTPSSSPIAGDDATGKERNGEHIDSTETGLPKNDEASTKSVDCEEVSQMVSKNTDSQCKTLGAGRERIAEVSDFAKDNQTQLGLNSSDVRDTEKHKVENLDLEKPWPPDKEISAQNVIKNEASVYPKDCDNVPSGKTDSQIAAINSGSISENKRDISKVVSKTSSPVTPASAGHTPVIVNPIVKSKEQSPQNAAPVITPTTSSIASSLSHKSSKTTPATTSSQMTKTPTFTTPSPASSSSTSSSKSLQKQKLLKNTVSVKPKSQSGQSSHQAKRPLHQGRQDHHSRSGRVQGSSSDHKRRSGHHQHPHKSSCNHVSKYKPEKYKLKPVPPPRIPMATITVGLDASPSKPLGRSELERLKMELESVKNQLNLEMSPSSLSPCSGDEDGGKSPAQLLSPVSPVSRSPADSMTTRKNDAPLLSTAQPGVSPCSTPTLTDRLKLLGRVKKRTPGSTPVVKTEATSLQDSEQRRQEFRQSRIIRSSIFDQDSERLSRARRQLEEEKLQTEEHNVFSLPAAVPLFSGSKFLEPNAVTDSSNSIFTPITNNSSISTTYSDTVTAPNDVPGAVDVDIATRQQPLSSLSGPKNVLSLSSSELPGTAERKAHIFAGKNCNNQEHENISNSDQLLAENNVSNVEIESVSVQEILTDPIEILESSVVVTDSVGDNVVEEVSLPRPLDIELPSDFLETPVNVIESTEPISVHPAVSCSDITHDVILTDELQSKSHTAQGMAAKPEENNENPKEIVLPASKEAEQQNLLSDTELPEDADDHYLGEIVGDMDVYAGSCMEIAETSLEQEVLVGPEEMVVETGEVQIKETSLSECIPTVHDDFAQANTEVAVLDEKDSYEDIGVQKVVDEKIKQEFDAVDELTEDKIPSTVASETKTTKEIETKNDSKIEPMDDDGDDDLPLTSVEAVTSKDITKYDTSVVKTATDQVELPVENMKDAPKVSQKLSTTKDNSTAESKKKSKESDINTHSTKKPKSKIIDAKAKNEPVLLSKPKSEKSLSSKSQKASSKDFPFKTEKLQSSDSFKKSLNPQPVIPVSSMEKCASKTDKDSGKTTVQKTKKISEKEELIQKKERTSSKERKLGKESKKDKKHLVEKKSLLVTDAKLDVKKLKKPLQRSEKSEESHSEKPLQKSDSSKNKPKHESKSEIEKSVSKTKLDSEQTLFMKDSVDMTLNISDSSLNTKVTSQLKEDKVIAATGDGSSGTKKKKKKKKHAVEQTDVPTRTEGDKKHKMKAKDGKVDSKEGHKKHKVVDKSKKLKTLTDNPKSEKKNPSEKSHGTENKGRGLNIKSSSMDSFSKKQTKPHSDLKSTNSLPAKVLLAESNITQTKKDKEKRVSQKKVEKSSSVSPAINPQSKYAMIYSSSSDSESSIGPPPSKKLALKEEPEEMDSQKIIGASSKQKKASLCKDKQNASKWPDLDTESRNIEKRRWSGSSFSSSSSMSDSGGPPPVVSSSLLVTETIKNETILPPGYDNDDESNDRKDNASLSPSDSEVKPEHVASSVGSVSKNKPPPKTDSSKVAKDKSKTEEKGSSSSSRRLLVSSSESDSDHELIISMSSDSEDEIGSMSAWAKAEADFDEPHTQSSKFGLDLSSDSDSFGDLSQDKVSQQNLSKSKDAPKKTTKMPDKSIKKDHVISSHKAASDLSDEDDSKSKKKNTDRPKSNLVLQKAASDCSDVESTSRKKVLSPKKKSKSKITKSTKKNITGDLLKSEDLLSTNKIPPAPTKPLKSKSKPESANSSADEEILPTSTLENKDTKIESFKLVSTVKESSHVKKTIDKTKSDSTIHKSSTKHHKKDKMKTKSHSSEKLTSQQCDVKKSKDSGVVEKTQHSTLLKTSKDPVKLEKGASKSCPKHHDVIKTGKKDHSVKSKHSSVKDVTVSKVSSNSDKSLKTPLKTMKEVSSHKVESKKLKTDDKKSELKTQDVGGKDSKHNKDKSPLDTKITDASKQDIHKHSKKKKLKKSHKREDKEKKSIETAAKKEIHSNKFEQSILPVQPKLSQQEQKALAHSLFSSDSDDDDDNFGLNVSAKDPATTSEIPSTIAKSQESKTASFESSKTNFKKEKFDHGDILIKEIAQKVGKESPQKTSPLSKTGTLHHNYSPAMSSLKTSEMRRGSAESFFTTSTTDESDAEQKIAVESVITSLDRDDVVEDNLEVKSEEDEEKPVSELFSPFVNANVQSEETECNRDLPLKAIYKPQTKIPAHKSEKKKKSSKKEKALRKEKERSKSHLPGYSRSKHSLPFVGKERREHIDKSSHERDEEAVRSIMGILDESSDADSYYSDVRPDDTTPSLTGDQTPDSENSRRRSRDSDVGSASSRTPKSLTGLKTDTSFDTLHETTDEPSTDLPDAETTTVEGQESNDAVDKRTTAEEKELAAAVSSIEGLLGDFVNKTSAFEDFSSTASSSTFAEQQATLAEQSAEEKEPVISERPRKYSQENEDKISSEAALAASALLLESKDEDSSDYNYQQPSNQHDVSALTEEPAEDGMNIDDQELSPQKQPTEDTFDIELPSIRVDQTPQTSATNTPVAALNPAVPPSSALPASRKRPRSRGGATSGRSSSRESKSDWSVSDASTSESELQMHESGKKTGRRKGKAAKQRKIGNSPSNITQQTVPKDSYDFDTDINQSTQKLSLPKPNLSEQSLPFVCTTVASHFSTQPSVATASSTSTSVAAVPFVTVSSSLSVAGNTSSRDVSFVSLKEPTALLLQSPRRQSYETETAPQAGPAKRRLSSSSISVQSPSQGSQLPQLTPPGFHNNTPASFGGMHIPGSFPSCNTAPFLSQSNLNPNNASQISPGGDIRLLSPTNKVLPNAISNPLQPPQNSQIPHGFQQQGYASPALQPAFFNQSQSPSQPAYTQMPHSHPMYMTRPGVPLDPLRQMMPPMSVNLLRPGQPTEGARLSQPFSQNTNNTSMPSHYSASIGMGSSVAQPVTYNNTRQASPLTLTSSSHAFSAATSLTTSLRQQQFAFNRAPGPSPVSEMPESSQPTQHHVGVPTYPHSHQTLSHQQQTPHIPQQSPQRTFALQQAASGHLETVPKSVPRPSFTQPQLITPGTYQPHMYQRPHPAQLSPQGYPQPGFALPSQSLPQLSQISPSATLSATAQSQVRHKPAIQRAPSNPYLPQQGAAQSVSVASRSIAPPLNKSSDSIGQPMSEKADTQRSQSAVAAPSHSQPGHPQHLAQVSPQTLYRKIDHNQSQPPHNQPGIPPQQVFAHHPLYYPRAGMHTLSGGFPGMPGLPYMQQPFILRPGMTPASAIHPTPTQFTEMAQAHQRMLIPQQMLPVDKVSQPQSTVQQQHMQTPTRKEQKPPAAVVGKPAHLTHTPYGMTQSLIPPSSQGPMHPVYAAASPVHSQRNDHGERVVRTPSDLSQVDMVDQHFRRSGIATTSPRAHVPTTLSVAASSGLVTQPDKLKTSVAHIKQDPTTNPTFSSQPGMYPHSVFPRPALGMHFSPGFPMSGGARYALPHSDQMWPRIGANFRPPSVSVATMQPHTSIAGMLNTAPHSMSMQQQHPVQMLMNQPPQLTPPPSTAPKSTSSDPSEQVMDLFQRYPVIWQGLLALKNDSAAVQTHFICGDIGLAQAYLPKSDTPQNETDKEMNLDVLRIVQRMRLDPPQLEGIDKRMMADSDFCLLLALPCGRDKADVIRQQHALKQGFIDYLKQKQAAGIVNVQHKQPQNEIQYVLHVFPPCDFTTKHLQRHAQDLLSNINDIQHIMIVIAAV